MARPTLQLDADDFVAAVPFGFVAERGGRIVTVGQALGRLSSAQPGGSVDESFRVVRPGRVSSFVDLVAGPRASVVLSALGSELELRGSVVAVGDGVVAFLGSAVVRDVDDFQRLGLHLGDFPPADATPELLLSMQATRTALEDARKLGRELEGALREAQAATEAKARFLAMMSHEIRTPLNGFGAMIDLLRDSPLRPEQRDNLATMDECARSLLVLLNDILEFSRLESDRVRIERRPTHVAAAIGIIVGHFSATARERGIGLALQFACDEDMWAAIDVERVRQVVSNLIGNAVKFTDRGAVVVQVAALAEARLCIDVRDTGVGIPSECVGRLFQPFVQADTSTTRRFGGTGLGLTISRQLARALGGDVELMHSDATGSWFRFTFDAPVCAPAAPDGAAPSSAAVAGQGLAGARVLVVDDDRTNRRIATRLLQKLGIEVDVVADGAEAVAAAQGHRFDLILMDMMMPVLGGADAARAIRGGDGPCRDVPILAFSAAAFDADRAAAAASGMNGFVEKPVRLESLRRTLHEHLGGRGAPECG